MSIHTLDGIYTALLYLCAAGQAVFVGAWFTTKWYETWVGRGLMTKSLTLSITLTVFSILRYTNAQFSLSTSYVIYICVFALMFLGITAQDVAILRELRLNKANLNKANLNRASLKEKENG
jgi:uncharacterized protein YjbI with pentapeptide repeats